MFKRGFDQLTAWILAVFLAGAVFGGGYFLTRLKVAHASAQGETEHAAAPEHGGADQDDHGETAPEGHDATDPAPKDAAHGGGNAAHWGYKGSEGPDKWGELAAANKACAVGAHQSPVDIDETVTNAKLLPIRFHYKADDAVLKNNGHTVQAEFPTGNFVEIDGERYDLLQFHVHTPSEHKVAGIPYDLELHLVHKNVDGNLAVIGVLFEEGAESKALKPVWAAMPREFGEAPAPVELNPATFLPERKVYYTYAGSLTTPPCTEGVKWLVLTDPVTVSPKQLDEIVSVVAFNARPVQPLKGRQVAKSAR